MNIEDLFTMDGFEKNIWQIKMIENDEKMVILCADKFMIKNMITQTE
jgi:hypothetical protein